MKSVIEPNDKKTEKFIENLCLIDLNSQNEELKHK